MQGAPNQQLTAPRFRVRIDFVQFGLQSASWKDFGAERLFPLLRASASVLHLPFARAHLTQEMVDSQLAAGKLVAKRALAGFTVNRLPATGVAAGLERIGREAA